MLSVFCAPTRYTQGRNATDSLGQEMKTLGLPGPVTLLAGRSAIALLSDVWANALPRAGYAYRVVPCGGECSLAEIERVETEAHRQRAGVIVGAGGGKALDTA